MVKSRLIIEREKESAYERLRLPTFDDMIEDLINIGEQIFNQKEKVGYAQDIHAMYKLSDDDRLEFVGFAGDEAEEDGSMHFGDQWMIVNGDKSYRTYLNIIEYQSIDYENCEIALINEWHENVRFGNNTDYGNTFFVSCYWLYSLLLKEINFSCKAEEILRHLRKE